MGISPVFVLSGEWRIGSCKQDTDIYVARELVMGDKL